MFRIVLMALCFALLSAAPARAGFEEGFAAYNAKDWKTAVENLRPLAEAGDDRAMVVLGNMYANGLGVAWSIDEAIDLYTGAAAKGNADAMLALGATYVNADGVTQSYITAADWFRRAAETGSPAGAFFYAATILRGNKSETDDLKSDPYTAYKWFKIAARSSSAYQQMSADAAARIAQKLLTPDKVAQAEKEAAAWQPAAR